MKNLIYIFVAIPCLLFGQIDHENNGVKLHLATDILFSIGVNHNYDVGISYRANGFEGGIKARYYSSVFEKTCEVDGVGCFFTFNEREKGFRVIDFWEATIWENMSGKMNVSLMAEELFSGFLYKDKRVDRRLIASVNILPVKRLRFKIGLSFLRKGGFLGVTYYINN